MHLFVMEEVVLLPFFFKESKNGNMQYDIKVDLTARHEMPNEDEQEDDEEVGCTHAFAREEPFGQKGRSETRVTRGETISRLLLVTPLETLSLSLHVMHVTEEEERRVS